MKRQTRLPSGLIKWLLAVLCQSAISRTEAAITDLHAIHLDDVRMEQVRRGGNGDLRRVLDDMVQQELLVRRAKEAGLEKDPEVQRAFRKALVGKLRERELTPKLEQAAVSADDIEREYTSHLQQYVRPARRHLALLQLRTAPTHSADRVAAIRARLEEARARALELPAGTPGFGALSVDYSDHAASRYRGGDFGWLEDGKALAHLEPSVLEAAASLSVPGAMSEIIRTANGFHLVRLIEFKPAETNSLDQVTPAIRQRLLAAKRQEIETAFSESARRNVNCTLFPEAMPATLASTPARPATPEPPSLP